MSIEANQIATKGDLASLQKLMEQMLANQAIMPAYNIKGDDYLSLDQVAELTGFSARTVKKWVEEGKPDRGGKIIRLLALEFSPGYLRIPRAALIAYGEGLNFTTANLKNPPSMRMVA